MQEIKEIRNRLERLEMSRLEKRALKVAMAAETVQKYASHSGTNEYAYLNSLIEEGNNAVASHVQRVQEAVKNDTVLEWLNRELDRE